MNNSRSKPSRKDSLIQILICFILPLIILTRFSDESQLGPAKGLILALLLPVIYESYNIYKNRKFNYLSLLAVIGIATTGAISLLGLDEQWLAYRRAAPYLAASLVILVSALIKHPIINYVLPILLDIDLVRGAVQKKHRSKEYESTIKKTSYAFFILFIALAVISFILTKIVIHSPTDTALFNQEYARLRIVGLAGITLPLIIGATFILFWFVSSLEKLTGLDFEKIIKKK